MSSKPQVSIGMPLYNAASYVASALDTILAQTYEDFELVIADNCSTDGTQDICREYVHRDTRVRLIARNKNYGAIDNFNFVFLHSRGSYFKWAAFDDVLEPTFLEKCVHVLESSQDVGWCYTRSDIIDSEGNSWLPRLDDNDPLVDFSHNCKWWRGHPRTNYDSDNPIKRFQSLLLGTPWSVDSYGLIRRSLLEKTRMLIPVYGSEKVLLGEMNLYAKCHYINETLFAQRVHQQASSSFSQSQKKRHFVSAKRRSLLSSSKVSLLVAHAYSVLRSDLAVFGKLKGLVAVLRYLFQVRKWGSTLVSMFSISGTKSDSQQMMERANRQTSKSQAK